MTMQSKELVEAYAKAKDYEVKCANGRDWVPDIGYDYFNVKLLAPLEPDCVSDRIERNRSDGIHIDVPIQFIVLSGRGNTIEKAYDNCLSHILEKESMSSNEELEIWLDLMNKT